jgi:HD-GYP domain-containing protein (c-di-GMP phosphodiesterase class II)
VADTLDAITSDRPYRAAQTVTAAREEIQRWSGRQFDPNVVKVFLSMPEHIWIDLRKEIDGRPPFPPPPRGAGAS